MRITVQRDVDFLMKNANSSRQRCVLVVSRIIGIFLAFLLCFAGMASPAIAAAFVCDGNIYQVQSGQLKIFDPLTSSYVNVGAAQAAYNAVGFNPVDGFAYGSQGTNLIRINADGSLTVVANIGFNSNSADMDDTGHLWLKFSSTSLRAITVASGATFATITLNATVNSSDLVIFPASNTAISSVSGIGSIARSNLSTGATTIVAVSGLPSDSYGAMWRDSAGRLFMFANGTGKIYEIFNYLSASPNAVFVAQGLPSGNNDGFSCPNAPFPNLPPLAFNDAFTTPFQTAVAGNVLVNNGGGVDNDPEGTVLTVTTTPVTAPTNGGVTLNGAGAFTYTPNAGFFGIDTFVYRITDASGLTATATVTITVSPPVANLVTVKTLLSTSATPSVGNTVTYRIAVTNNGPDPVPAPGLIDQVPAGLTFASATPSQGSYASGTGVWSIGLLPSGMTATLTLSATVNTGQQGATITNTTTAAAGGNTDGTTTGDDLTETVVVSNSALTLVKSFVITTDTNANGKLDSGDVVRYTFTVKNTGNTILSNVAASETAFNGGNTPPVPSGEILSIDAAPAGDSSDGNPSAGIWGTLAKGDTIIFTASYTANQGDIDALQP